MPTDTATRTSGLVVEDVTVAFGGLIALDEVNLTAEIGQVTGLIGPNGAGKTTLFNVICGAQRCTRGRVMLLGQDIGGWRPHRRAAGGLGRTFQRMELFWSMTVAETVALAVDAEQLRGGTARRFRPGRTEAALAARVEEILDLCRLDGLASTQAGALSTGQARVLELARAIATRPRILLLDEPSSGLDTLETQRFADTLQRVFDQGDSSSGHLAPLGVVLVEHDVELVFALCQQIHVLEFGRIIATGSPEEIQSDATVRAAYLGEGIV
jgi:ABC-type branched-subunit amino acid transport system ATPase component